MPRTHEQRFDGFVVGWVPRAAAALRPPRLPKRYRAPLRELGSRAGDADLVIPHVRVVSAGCLCGWRSVPCIGLGPARWERSSMHVSPRADAVLTTLWREHASSGRRAAARQIE